MAAPRRSIAPLVLALLLAGTSSAVGAGDWPVPRGPSHEPMPYRYDPSQRNSVPKAFLEDAAACTLYSGLTYLLDADGTVETITHDVVRLNGRKGIDKLGEYRSIVYTPAYQKLTLNEARVLKPTGQAVPIEARHVQLRDVATDYQVYDQDKQLIISFPNLEVGDVIEVKWTTRGKNPEYHGRFFARYGFGDDQFPVAQDVLHVRVPKAETLRYAAVGGRLDPEIREEGESRTYHWRATNRRELSQDDNTPSKEELRLQVAFSTFASWEEVRKWKQDLRADCWKCTPEIRQVVQQVTRDAKTPLEKARALTYWVRRHIRYLSTGEKHDFTPHAPGVILRNRFGDCKDQSQLLAVMLREAGVPVGLATLGARDDGQVLEAVPSPWGTHAILLVTIDGKEHWIDTTVSLAGWDFLPRDDRDRLTYVVDEKGLRMVRTPGLTADDNRIEQTTQVSVGPDGSSRSERVSTHFGLAALGRRQDWTDVPPGERRRLVSTELQDAQSRARLVRLTLDEGELQDFDRPVSARTLFETPGHFSGETELEGSLTDSKVWGKLLAFNLDYDRTVSLELPAPFESIHRYLVQLPPSHRVDDLPAGKTVRSAWGFLRLTVRQDPTDARRVEVTYHTRLEKTRVEPADFEAFRQFHEEVIKVYRVWLTLKRTHDLADAPALEVLLALSPGDRTSAESLVRLYEENGRSKDAWRVVQRARACNPDDTALWELSVNVAESRPEEEAAYRELMRRYPDEPKYPLALGTSRTDEGDYGGARAVLEPVTRKGPAAAKAAAHYQLARGEFLQGKAGNALEHWKQAEQADPATAHTADSWRLRAKIHEKLGRPKDASADYKQALKREPESEEILLALVRLGLDQKESAEALDSLRRYTVAVGNRLDGLARAADLYLRLGRAEEAFDLACRARDIGFHARVQRTLGLVYLQRGNFERAVFHLDRADADAEVIEGLIRGYVALGRLHGAERQAERADKVAEPTPALHRACAGLVALAQRRIAVRKEVHVPADRADAWNRAVDSFVCAEHLVATNGFADRLTSEAACGHDVEALLTSAFVDNVELGPAYALRGILSLERGRLTKALADAERAVVLSPAEPRGYYVRGRVRLERDQEGAVADLTKAAELSQRQQAQILHWLAAALSRKGRMDEAVRVQRQAVQLEPHNHELTEQLKDLEKAARAAAVRP